MAAMSAPQVFDRPLARLRLARALAGGYPDFLLARAVDDLDERLRGVAQLLGVARRGERREAGEVGEEHRDLLALALQGRVGLQDLLGEMRRGIAVGRSRRSLIGPIELSNSRSRRCKGGLHMGGFPRGG